MKHTILLVDDEQDNVDALERLFRRKYKVIKSTSGKQALEILETCDDLALIISDQRMPGMTGVEMLKKSIPLFPNAIRILLTGYTDIESVIDSINSGEVYRYLTKPWDPVDLVNTIDKAIERYEMGHELKKKNRELKKAYNELKTLDEAKNQFMILVNHELKTPLTVILSYLQLLNDESLSEDQMKYIGRIASSADRLHELIDDVLELVSAETGVTKVKKKSTDLQKIIHAAIEPFEEVAKQKGLQFHIEAGSIKASVDEELLKKVIRRLIDNSIKFSSPGEISLEILEADQGVQMRISNPTQKAPSVSLDRLLQPFTLDEDMLNHSQGTGMGLSVCNALLKAHGSSLNLQAPKGQFIAQIEL